MYFVSYGVQRAEWGVWLLHCGIVLGSVSSVEGVDSYLQSVSGVYGLGGIYWGSVSYDGVEV